MQLQNGDFCPFIQGKCKQLECVLFTKVTGKHPNTGADVDEYACAVAWLPALLIENAQQARQTGAAVESCRNVVAEAPGTLLQVLFENAGQRRLK